MLNAMIIHVIPKHSLFVRIVQKNIAHDDESFIFLIGNSAFANIATLCGFLSKRNIQNPHIIFHSIDNILIFFVRMILRDSFDYSYIYWGYDYCRDFLSEQRLDRHCYSANRSIVPFVAALPQPKRPGLREALVRIKGKFMASIHKCLSIYNLSGCNMILSLTRKQYRYLCYKYFLSKRRNPPFFRPSFRPYQESLSENFGRHSVYPSLSPPRSLPRSNDSISVLICNSAASTLNHLYVASLLKSYVRKYSCKVLVKGFISYGASLEARIRLRESLHIILTSFCSVQLCTDFLDRESLLEELSAIDVAVFGAARDEGVSLLESFASLGGVISMNSRSMNFDFFRDCYKDGLISHESFLAMSPEELIAKRMAYKVFNQVNAGNYDVLHSLSK